MVLQDKYKRANSSRYRAKHGGIESNRQLKAKAAVASSSSSSASQSHHFPPLLPSHPAPLPTPSSIANDLPSSVDSNHLFLPPTSDSSDFTRRVLASNADRYLEPEPDPNVDEETEAEIDLGEFVKKQMRKIAEEDASGGTSKQEEDVDRSFDKLFEHSRQGGRGEKGEERLEVSRRGKPAKVVISDPSCLGLDELDEQRKKADATRDLIARFSATQLPPNNHRPLNHLSRLTPASTKPTSANTNNTPSSNQLKEIIIPLDDQDFLDQVLDDASGTYGKLKRT
ncbi:hypothetical protein VP01_1460g5 [Puccinia sorghi]|uniref:Uncharacterized protein n=1 Tax=Puccinia sorghi TaxID=27349 RepID=A0A0L6VKF9_9BASI|nr:hypothetical protein VP01_1460g5 [Puccinia sorghi]